MTLLRNWDWIVLPFGCVAPGLPLDDRSYYDEGTDQFLDNVLGAERCASPARLGARCGGKIVPVDTARCRAAFLLDQGSRSVSTAPAGGNASLVTIDYERSPERSRRATP